MSDLPCCPCIRGVLSEICRHHRSVKHCLTASQCATARAPRQGTLTPSPSKDAVSLTSTHACLHSTAQHQCTCHT